MVEAVIIGFFWAGGDCPQWRVDCFECAKKVMGCDKTIAFIDSAPCDRFEAIRQSEIWRFNAAAENKDFLWLDSDIYLDSKIDLPDGPAVALEYGIKHWSIVWSGNNPKVFLDARPDKLQKNELIETVKIPGTHWASTVDHQKVRRKYGNSIN